MSDRAERHGVQVFLACLIAAIALACASAGVGPNADAALEPVDDFVLERFMGRWYVIASRGTSAEEGAHNAIEEYALQGDGTIDITFSFNAYAFDGPREVRKMVGWIPDADQPAAWRVRPFWPLRLAYLVIDLADDYGWCVVGHPSKKWVWIMARETEMDDDTYEGILERLQDQGYDVSMIAAVPQAEAETTAKPGS